MDPQTAAPQPLPPIGLGRTLRFGLRAAWDALGLVLAASLTLFVAACLPLLLVVEAGRLPGLAARVAATGLGIAAWLLVVPPLYGGACWMANQAQSFEETGYLEMWRGARRLYGRAVALGAVQAVVSAALAANALFYATRGNAALTVFAVVFLYLTLLWAMNAVYHWPLLVAGEAGTLARDDGGKPGVWSVLRNAFVMTVSAPGFTFGIIAIIMAASVPLAASGVGMALLLGGTCAFMTTRAARDQLVRFGKLPPPPDPDTPAVDEGWRV